MFLGPSFICLIQYSKSTTVYDPKRVDETARYQANKLLKGDLRGFAEYCGELGRNDVLRSLNETVIQNAGRDKKKGVHFARVPTGAETCTFCLMLASRGAVYHTRKTAGEFRHLHRRCDCKVVPGFDPDPDAELVEGVKPKELYEQWRAFERVDKEVDAPSLTKQAMKRQIPDAPASKLDATLGEVVPWLGAVDRYLVPDAKLNAYALSYTGDSDKTRAFESALGFTPSDAPEVIRQLYERMADNPPTYRGKTPYGDSYTSSLMMKGSGGKTAKVTAGLIQRPGDSKMQLASIYVDE